VQFTKDGEPVGLVFKRMSAGRFAFILAALIAATVFVAWGVASASTATGRIAAAIGGSVCAVSALLAVWSRFRSNPTSERS
jgi:hypothetical protein